MFARRERPTALSKRFEERLAAREPPAGAATHRPLSVALASAGSVRPALPVTARGTGFIPAGALLLMVMTVVAYLPAIDNGFIWDDLPRVQHNKALRSPAGLREIWIPSEDLRFQYYPMVQTSFWLEYRLWGPDPAGYHVVNIVLHALCVVLLWRVLATLRVPGAWGAAAVFALHPVHVESVAWITERKNVLSGMFYFSSTLAYLHYSLRPKDRSVKARSGRLYAVSLVLFLFALLTKTATCTLPAVLLLVIWWKRARIDRTDVRALAPFFALGIALGLLTAWIERDFIGGGEAWNRSFAERCLTAGRALFFYAGKLVWPSQLSFIYPRWRIDPQAWQQYQYLLLVVCVVAALWLSRMRMGRGPLVGVLCFCGMLFPALGFVDIYFARYSYVADHWQYIASTGPIALATAAGYRVAVRLGRPGRAMAVLALVCVLSALGTLSWRQGRVYASEETLWRDTIKKNPDAWMAHYNLANNVRAQGRLDEAIRHYRRALRIKPNHVQAHTNLGATLSSKRKLDEAISHYREALRIDPDHTTARANLGNALAAQRKLAEAFVHYREALRTAPRSAATHSNFGLALTMAGRYGEALAHFREAARLEPDEPHSLNGMAWILLKHPSPEVRAPDQAIRLAERACALTGFRHAGFLNTLAAAYAAAGRNDRARAATEAARALSSPESG